MSRSSTEISPKLKVKFAGIEFRSPIGVGPMGVPLGKGGTPELHAEVLLKHVEAGAGYISLPGTLFQTEETIAKLRGKAVSESLQTKINSSRFFKSETPEKSAEGIYSLFSPFIIDVEYSKRTSPDAEKLTQILLKKKPKDVRIVANIAALGDFPETAIDACKRWEELGVDLIEFNSSCPMCVSHDGSVDYFYSRKFPLRMMGSLVGDQEDLMKKFLNAIGKAIKIPFGVKTSPETGFPRVVGMARDAENAGAKFISAMNSAVGIVPPDIYNRGKPKWAFTDGNPFVMASGPWLRMQCYKQVAGVAKFVPSMDITAGAGIMSPEHAVEVMMFGAKLVQLCSGVLLTGRNLIKRCNEFLVNFMQAQGYESIEDFVGLGVQYIKPTDQLDLMPGKVLAEIDYSKCTECGICVDNVCIAPYMDNGRVTINSENCNGCGGCLMMCPRNAINLVLKE